MSKFKIVTDDNILREIFNYRNYEPVGDYGVTSLEKPFYWRALREKYPEENCLDYTSKVDSALGTGFHMYAEEAMRESLIPSSQEVKLEGKISGYLVGGTCDLLVWEEQNKARVCDYKTMKSYPAKKAYNGEEHDKFIHQLSIYAYLLRKQGYETYNVGYIYVVIGGWTQRDKDLPRVFRIDVKLMGDKEVEEYVKERIEGVSMDKVDCPQWLCERYCELREVCPHFNNHEFADEAK